MNAFDIKLAWWMARGQSRRIWLVVFCVALGVTARVAVGTFMGQLDKALSREARNLLMADVEVSQKSPLTETQKSELARALPDGSKTQNIVHFITMAAAPSANQTRLVELRAVEESYPFYGKFELSDQPALKDQNSNLNKLFEDRPFTYVQSDLLLQLGLHPGDKLRLGKTDFTIAGTIAHEPGLGANIYSLGPRVLIGANHVAATGLIEFGSRVYYSTLVALRDSSRAEELARALRETWQIPERKKRRGIRSALGPERMQVRTFRDAQFQIRDFFDRLEDYLSLTALVALILGGIGVGSVIRGYIYDHLESAAILKTLGASGKRISRVYFFQIAGIGLAGSALGCLFGTLVQNLFPLVFSGFLPVPIEMGVHWPAILWGAFLGTATASYFGLWPLLETRDTKPLSIFRGEPVSESRGALFWIVGLVGLLLFALIASVEARSIKMGSAFCAGTLCGGAALFFGGRWVLPRLAASRSRFAGFGFKHGLANLARPGLRPYSAIVTVGLSALLLGLVPIYQTCLSKEIDPGQRSVELPNLFLIDIQDDQIADLREFLRSKTSANIHFSPMVKARYREINGRPIEPQKSLTREGQDNQNMRNREQNLSMREELGSDETITQGRWMGPTSHENEASLEEWFAERLGAKLGDTLTFDVQGVKIDAKVTSLRKVRWASFNPNFFVLLSPRLLENAPKTWVGSISGLDRAGQTSVQMTLVQKFPNITLIDVAEAGQRILSILQRISWAVRVVALFSLGAGLVVLIGIALSSARLRRTDAALLKALGAGRRILFSSIAVEFGLLGAVAGGLGALLSIGFSWVLVARFLEMDFSVPWAEMALILVLLACLCSAAGVLACWPVFKIKPLEALREA